MATMEYFRTRLAQVRAETVRTGKVALGVPTVVSTVQAACHFLLSAVLSGGVIFGGSAPFGVALVGGAGSGINAAAALLGACLGYVALLGLVEGLRYVSAAILTFSVAFAFCDVRLYGAAWTMPMAAALMNGCAGFIYLSQKGWRTVDVIFFTIEIVLTALCAYGFRAALSRQERWDGRSRRLGSALLLCAVLVSMIPLAPVADVSLGRIGAGVAVLFLSWLTGAGEGAAFGVLLGLAMDMASWRTPLYAMMLGVAGLAAGLFSGRRFRAAAGFLLAGAAAVLWTWDGGVRACALYEAIIAAGVFLAVPGRLWERLGALVPREQSGQWQDGAREYVSRRLQSAAQAFHTLNETMRTAFRRPAVNDGDTAVVFDRAADRVCKRCVLRSTCWERDYVTTFNALNDATRAMLDRGRSLVEDFPAHFSGRCVHLREFLAAVNEELTGLLCRRQYASRIRDSRRAVCSQYGQLSRLLTEAAEELGAPLSADPVRQRRLRQHMGMLGLKGDGAVFYDREGHLRVRICGPAAEKLSGKEETAVLSDLMGMPLHRQEQDEDVLVLAQSEPFMAVAGIAARRKDNEPVSGDAGTWFKRENGRLYMLLCDGMGSGAGANRESGLAVRLLEQFLKAGVETENALSILNGAMSLRGEEEGGFTTVDLLELDLFTGRAAIWKLGAAPTYVRTEHGVRRVSATTMPAGAAEYSSRPDCARFVLTQGDWVLMVSDGICPDGADEQLRALLAGFEGESPKDLARAVLEQQTEEAGKDDRTVLAIRLLRRPGTGK